MITHFTCDGFKSLNNFSLNINPGINVLVGPNGAGKTNIISFLEFIGSLVSQDLQYAVSKYGGAGSAFRKIGASNYNESIHGEIYGLIDLSLERNGDPTSPAWISYKYIFDINLSNDREFVYFNKQQFCIKKTPKKISNPIRISKWDVTIERLFSANTKQTTTVEINNRSIIRPYRLRKIEDPEIELALEIDDLLGFDDSIIHSVRRLLDYENGGPILRDFNAGNIYNPIPQKVREPEDSAKSPGIRSDGTGLYATLFAIKKRKERNVKTSRVPKPTTGVSYASKISLNALVDYFKLAFPAIKKIEITNDSFDNKIKARITLNNQSETQIPFSALSDGTLKWMSLITAVTTTSRIFAVEEPENFIHPRLQSQALNIIRDNVSEGRSVILSTHSETILNETRPNEVIVVSLKDGNTVATRLKDPEFIANEINNSGFGLGYHYIAGSFDDV